MLVLSGLAWVTHAQSHVLGSELEVHISTVQRTLQRQQDYAIGIRACQALERMGPQAVAAVPVLAEAARVKSPLLPSGILREGATVNIEFRQAAVKALAAIGRRADVAVPALAEALQRWPEDSHDYENESLGSVRQDLAFGSFYKDVEEPPLTEEYSRMMEQRRDAHMQFLASAINGLAAYGAESSEAMPVLVEFSDGMSEHERLAEKWPVPASLRIGAVRALAAIASPGNRDAVEAIQRIAFYETKDRNLKSAARSALELIQSRATRSPSSAPATAPPTTGGVEAPATPIRGGVSYSSGANSGRVDELLATFTNQTAPLAERLASCAALQRHAGGSDAVRAALIEGLRDNVLGLRAAIALRDGGEAAKTAVLQLRGQLQNQPQTARLVVLCEVALSSQEPTAVLSRTLQSGYPAVRFWSVHTLGLAARTEPAMAGEALKLVDATLANDSDPQVRLAAAAELISAGTSDAAPVEVAAQVATDPQAPPQVRARAIHLLAKCSRSDAATAGLRHCLNDQDAAFRGLVQQILGNVPSGESTTSPAGNRAAGQPSRASQEAAIRAAEQAQREDVMRRQRAASAEAMRQRVDGQWQAARLREMEHKAQRDATLVYGN
jgi:hypothetical protein